MQHTYAHYRNNEHANDNKSRLNIISRTNSIRTSQNTPDQPSWRRQKSKLSRLKNRCNHIVVNSKQTAFVKPISEKAEWEGRKDYSTQSPNYSSSDVSVSDSFSASNSDSADDLTSQPDDVNDVVVGDCDNSTRHHKVRI